MTIVVASAVVMIVVGVGFIYDVVVVVGSVVVITYDIFVGGWVAGCLPLRCFLLIYFESVLGRDGSLDASFSSLQFARWLLGVYHFICI